MANFAIEDDFKIYQIFKIEELYLTKWMILASSSCKFGGDNLQLQDKKCSCFNSCQQCASQKNYLGGIIKKNHSSKLLTNATDMKKLFSLLNFFVS